MTESSEAFGSYPASASLRGAALAEPSFYQLELMVAQDEVEAARPEYRARLTGLLAGDLSFHGQDTGYASHDLHAFPAKFPPQLPRLFIRSLLQPGDTVLDPMMGSGTTVVEGYLASCLAIGVDIDPLAKLITEVKTSALDIELLRELGNRIVREAAAAVEQRRDWLADQLAARWDAKTRDFVDYWFARETQLELLALVKAIAAVPDERVRAFFQLALSACIITKSGGVSLAFDLAHTRPHRAKIAYSPAGELVVGAERREDSSPRTQLLTKRVKSALGEFRKRVQQNIGSLAEIPHGLAPAQVHLGDAQRLPVGASQVDLIVTSPPYAVNAIDYMRANKFSLVWLGYTLDELAQTRKDCIGGENTAAFAFEELPDHTANLVREISALDAKRGRALQRYYSEMTRILREMHRVLKPGRAAIVVVASSAIRDRDTETDTCLGEIGRALGFELAGVGVRQLDRNRRMMPAGHQIDGASQIQKRMHEEFVIGFYKPRRSTSTVSLPWWLHAAASRTPT